MPQICDMEQKLYFSSEGRHAEDFSAGSEPAILSTRGQRANHYTTEPATFYGTRWFITLFTTSGVTRGGFGGSNPPPSPKFRSFDKGEPNSLSRRKYIRNNLIIIRVSLICKLSGTPDEGISSVFCPMSSSEFVEPPPSEKFPRYATVHNRLLPGPT
jgi:hypothetical protein